MNENNTNIIEESPGRILEDLNESGQNEIPEELVKLMNNPIDLNSADVEIFAHFNLLTNTQIQELKEYISKNGNLIEKEELQQIEAFDKNTILKILPFSTITINEKRESAQQITIRVQKKLNTVEEYFPGSSEKILLKYKSRTSSTINYSFTGEKDAGEEIFTKNKNGFDFNSFYIIYAGKTFINKIIIGDYIAQYGQGLTLWQGLGIGGGAGIAGIYKSGRGTIPYSGTDENRFFRGFTLSVGKKRINTDFWFSQHRLDANKFLDTLNDEVQISSFQTSGYHRSDFENFGYHSQKELCLGSSLRYNNKKLNVGIVTIFGKYEYKLNSEYKPYNLYYFRGREFFNTGLFYNYSIKNIFIFGENTVDEGKSIAMLYGTLISLDPRFALGYSYRNYPRNFNSLKSNAFGENSNNNNETGSYLGINYKIFNWLSYSFSMDLFSFRYLKYRVDQPSRGYDLSNQIDYVRGKKFTAQLRIQRKMKQQNETLSNETFHRLTENKNTSYRISIRMKMDNTWELGFRTEYVIPSNTSSKQAPASSVSQSIFFHPLGKSFSANARYSIFNCPSFDSRIYEYENDLPGAFSIPFYYGRGSRFYLNFNCRIMRSINFSIRYSISWIENAGESDKESSEIKLQTKINFK
jgi:hypothetical protein